MEKAQMVCLVLEPGTAGWSANPLSPTHLSILKKLANPRLLIYFQSFSNKQYNFYNKSMWKYVISFSIQRWDLNPRPLKHESSPQTTRPGPLPSFVNYFLLNFVLLRKRLKEDKIEFFFNPGSFVVKNKLVTRLQMWKAFSKANWNLQIGKGRIC